MNILDIDFSVYEEPARYEIQNSFIKMRQYFYKHENILVSVSGGSDSDCIVHMICKYFPEYLHKCHFVFCDTGLEYEATKNHLKYMEQSYKIEIEKIRGKSVVYAVKEYGIPILSKEKSEWIDAYCRNLPYGIVRYNRRNRYGFTDNQRLLVDYIKENGIKISKKCCDISKKHPIKEYIKQNKIDLNVTGERKCEHGLRAYSHHSCYTCDKNGKFKFMPIFYWSKETKEVFKTAEKIIYSDCYEVYGMERTGCCGCPYNVNIGKDLKIMKQYEPKLYTACMNVFGLAYELTDRFNARKKKIMGD